MTRTPGFGKSLPAIWPLLAAAALLCGAATPAAAFKDDPSIPLVPAADGIHVTDGTYVMNVGELQINITNWGLIGSNFSIIRAWSDAPSAQWPAGSGDEYLWEAGLWVGGVMLGEPLVSQGGYVYGLEFRPLPELQDTIYEARRGKIIRPPGNDSAGGQRDQLDPDPDDDDDGRIDEETLNGYDDDGDGKIDEDFAQIGSQMLVFTMYDNTRLAQEQKPDHTPMNLQVVQSSYAWENDNVDDFVGFEFKITNIGVTEIDNVYIGFFADSDIGRRGSQGLADDDMAGFWPRAGDSGLVKSSDGSWVPIQVGYMYDGAEQNRLEGYFGILFLDHDTDPTGLRAPQTVGMRAFQSFSGNQPFDQGGDPRDDSQRYELLSEPSFDQNTQPGKQADFRFMVSAGPFRTLEPDETLTFEAAMVCGPGLEGMLRNCAEAALTYYGNFFNKIPDFTSLSNPPVPVETGVRGRETMLCREDFAGGTENPFDNFIPDVMDTTCVSQEWALDQPRIGDQDIFLYTGPDGEQKHCAYFNMDNCFECARQLGHLCTAEGREIQDRAGYTCSDPDIPDDQKAGCTGVGGNETQVNWLVGMAPPPPGMRLWPTNQSVHVYWSDESEHAPDARLNVVDFESYRIWRADNWTRPYGSSIENGPESSLWQLVNEYDLVDFYIQSRQVGSVTVLDTLPLGRNTGLEAIRYSPVCLDSVRHPEYLGIWGPMRDLVMADVRGQYRDRPALRDAYGDPVGGPDSPQAHLLPWENKPAILDTFFAVIERPEDVENGVRGKRATSYYEYVDSDVHNGYLYFYSVTATDHGLDYQGGSGTYRITGAGQVGDPGSSFQNTVPGAVAQTAEQRKREGANIYVYPNPATRTALAEFQQLFPNADDPTGVRVTFTNLPEAHNTIKIWTLDGDLIQELQHDGTGGYGQISWNLISRNGQEIVSGIYLYSVQSDDDRFDDFIGKFVVIR